MGRKNIFEVALDAASAPADNATPFRRTGAPSVSTLGNSLRDMSENGIQDLDPSQIETNGIQDRLELDPLEIKKLAESIREHGQQVPILVRPNRDSMNRFTIVYGRRRLAAIRSLGEGVRVKAIVRHLEDDAAIVAQGQENNLRIDPSYIEKALFARELRHAGYEGQVIQDALSIDRTAISKMMTVVENIPEPVILFIGAAQDIGRRLWTELATLSRDEAIDLLALLPTDPLPGSTGADRFELVMQKARETLSAAAQQATVPAVTVAEKSDRKGSDVRRFDLAGRHVGTMKKTGRSLSLSVSLRHQPKFGQWIEENADEVVQLIHDHWKKNQGET